MSQDHDDSKESDATWDYEMEEDARCGRLKAMHARLEQENILEKDRVKFEQCLQSYRRSIKDHHRNSLQRQIRIGELEKELEDVKRERDIHKECRNANADARDAALNQRDAARAEVERVKRERDAWKLNEEIARCNCRELSKQLRSQISDIEFERDELKTQLSDITAILDQVFASRGINGMSHREALLALIAERPAS